VILGDVAAANLLCAERQILLRSIPVCLVTLLNKGVDVFAHRQIELLRQIADSRLGVLADADRQRHAPLRMGDAWSPELLTFRRGGHGIKLGRQNN
jgi:hypothetical protein